MSSHNDSFFSNSFFISKIKNLLEYKNDHEVINNINKNLKYMETNKDYLPSETLFF